MSNTLLIKRSATPGAVPSTANVALGELAINTYDGRLFTKIDTGTPSIFELTQNQPITATGNVTGTSVNGVGNSTISLTLSTTGVAAGTYGGTSGATSNIGVFTVDQYGRITSASNSSISTSELANGNASVSVYANGNISINPGGASNVVVFSTTGEYINGLLSVSGNVAAGNVNTAIVSASGNITAANFNTGGELSTGGNIIAGPGSYFIGNGSQLTGVTASGVDANNLTGNTLAANVVNSSLTSVGTLTSLSVAGNTTGGNISVVGNIATGGILTDNYYYANGTPLDFQQPAGSNTQLQFNNNDNFGASANLTFDSATNVLTVTGTSSTTGNVVAGNVNTTVVSASGNVTGASFNTTGQVSASGNVTAGNVNTTVVSASGNVIGGNVTTAGLVDAGNVKITSISNQQVAYSNNGLMVGSSGFTYDAANAKLFASNIDSNGAITTSGTISATGNVTAGNVLFGSGQVSGTGNITGGNLIATDAFIGNISLSGNVDLVNVNASGYISATGTVTAGNFSTVGYVTATGNVTGGNILTSNNISAGGNVISGNVNTGAVSASGNVTAANINFDSGVVSGSGNVVVGNVITTGIVSAGGNVTGANFTSSGNISVGGNITSANVNTGVMSASGNVTGSNINTSGLASISGNVISGNVNTGAVSASGNVDAANYLTTGLVSASGNVTGGNLVATTAVATGNVVSTGALNLQSGGSGNLVLDAAGNIDASSNYINNVLDPQQDQDAATKAYVDRMVSSGIAYHQPVLAATVGNLATATGGTITYSQPNGAGNGVGAIISTTGAFTLIDTANIQTVGTRVLVKDEGNAVINGVYTYANSTALIRSTDTDEYGPDSTEQLSVNDYFFVQGGNVNKGSAYVVSAPSGIITFGTSNIEFSQFSSSQTYTANTQAGISLAGTVFSAKVDNDTTAFDGSGNIIVKASANLTTPNIGAATGSSLSVTGNVTGGNINFGSGVVNGTGNVTAGNILTGGLISATGNITTGNVSTGIITASGNITGGNVNATGISASGNITAANATVTNTANVATLVVGTFANITATTISTSNITGALTVAGGVGVTGNVYADGMYVLGDSVLTVNSIIDGGTY